jgi:glutamate N-acetyltransferase / amino-acid N-acetyltransferase
MKIYKKAALPRGFTANGIAAGIKRSGKPDLALFFSALPSRAAVACTANTVKAAPLKINQKYLKSSRSFQAIVVNSGNANCFTGKAGVSDAAGMTLAAARSLGIKKENVLVASTGIIGKRLPLGKIKNAMPALVRGLTPARIARAKQAILTTDTFSKEVTVKVTIGGRAVTLCGVAKGSGMIAPNMATMLAFIFTDAAIAQKALQSALQGAVEESFNCISVDNCMSTNDTVIVLANGLGKNTLIRGGKGLGAFSEALKAVCLELAKMIVKDGEGATKFIRVRVSKARTIQDARRIALSIARSDLFKTALYGESPNFFGRAVAAAGASGVAIKEEELKVKASPLRKKEITIDVSVNAGKAQATVYTCDLTHGYIKINTEYN